jgi:DMSO/TMAO reductase YedYZ molybdopterin-dependent catalytic subunit
LAGAPPRIPCGYHPGSTSREISREVHRRHPLRDEVDETGHDLVGVSLDSFLDAMPTQAAYALAFFDGGYTTNIPLADLRGGKAWVVDEYEGRPLDPEHGGPARLLVPHLYFWKSAKWIRGLDLRLTDQPGFWEMFGYRNYGDPWKEQRYYGD